MNNAANAISTRAADFLLDVLRSKRLGYALNGLAIALLVALAVRHHLGYSPKTFFLAALPFVLFLSVASLASLIVQRTNKSIFDFLLAMATGCLMALAALLLSGRIPPTAYQVYRSYLAARAEVYGQSLPGDVPLFLDGYDKTNLKSFSELAKSAGRYHERWRGNLQRQGFSEGEARAISFMLFTSTLWAFGNETHPEKEGCIISNEDNNWRYAKPTFEVVRRTRIGCCTDYAYALSLILSKNGFENRYVLIPGHIFNEAKIDGTWRVLDANTNVFINASWNDAIAARLRAKVHVFPHPGQGSGRLHRPIIGAFQNYVVDMVRFGQSGTVTLKVGRDPDPEYRQPIDLLH